jgi:hypothetical protein
MEVSLGPIYIIYNYYSWGLSTNKNILGSLTCHLVRITLDKRTEVWKISQFKNVESTNETAMA